MTQRPHPEALLDAAVRYANHGIPILPDQLVNRRPDPAAGPPVCACRRRDCPALPIHGPRRLDRDNDAWHTSHVGRWWTANPDAAIATVAGVARVPCVVVPVEPARPVYWQCWAVAAAAGADGRASGGVGPAVDELVGEDGNAVVGVADGGIEQCFGMRSLGHLGISSCCMARRRVPPIVRPVGWTRSRWVAGGSVVASS